jgi:hypothetical protein
MKSMTTPVAGAPGNAICLGAGRDEGGGGAGGAAHAVTHARLAIATAPAIRRFLLIRRTSELRR